MFVRCDVYCVTVTLEQECTVVLLLSGKRPFVINKINSPVLFILAVNMTVFAMHSVAFRAPISCE
jgi:hypothetical protein